MRRAVFALFLLGCVLPAPALAAGSVLICQGRLTQATGSTNQPGIEFTLEYAEGMQVAQFESNFEAINGPLLFQLDDGFLRAKQSQPKALGANARSIGVSELRVSRNSGQFTLSVVLYRDIDLADGGATWEGLCRPQALAGGKKF